MIEYIVSLYPSIFAGRHYTKGKNKPHDQVILYISTISKFILEEIIPNSFVVNNEDEKEKLFWHFFKSYFIHMILEERLCLAFRRNNRKRLKLGLGKKKMRNRCKEYKDHSCKMDYLTEIVMEYIY